MRVHAHGYYGFARRVGRNRREGELAGRNRGARREAGARETRARAQQGPVDPRVRRARVRAERPVTAQARGVGEARGRADFARLSAGEPLQKLSRQVVTATSCSGRVPRRAGCPTCEADRTSAGAAAEVEAAAPVLEVHAAAPAPTRGLAARRCAVVAGCVAAAGAVRCPPGCPGRRGWPAFMGLASIIFGPRRTCCDLAIERD